MGNSGWPRTLALLSVAPLLGAAVFTVTSKVTAHREAKQWALLQAASATQELAARLVVCGDRGQFDVPGGERHALPPTSKKAPASVPRGDAVRTTTADWDDPVFRYADFRLVEAQPFQIQWVKDPPTAGSHETTGSVKAFFDMDGDGVVDHIVESGVACDNDYCRVAPAARFTVVQ